MERPGLTFSPRSGCAIGVIALLVFGGLAIWASYTLWEQNRQIATFTSDEAMAIPVVMPPDQGMALKKRLSAFGQQLLNDEPGELALNAKDLNHLIAIEEKLADWQEKLQFMSIDSEEIVADISWPMNRLGFGKKHRFLNGSMSLVPKMVKKGVQLQLVKLKSEVGQPAEGFVGFLQKNSQFLGPYYEDETLKPYLERIRGARLEGDRLIVQSGPPEK